MIRPFPHCGRKVELLDDRMTTAILDRIIDWWDAKQPIPITPEQAEMTRRIYRLHYAARLVTVLRARLRQMACSDETLTTEEWSALGLPRVASGPHPWRWQGIRMEATDGR